MSALDGQQSLKEIVGCTKEQLAPFLPGVERQQQSACGQNTSGETTYDITASQPSELVLDTIVRVSPWLLVPESHAFDYAGMHKLDGLAELRAAQKGPWSKALSVIFYGPGISSDLLQNCIYSLVEHASSDNYIVVTWRRKEFNICRSLNLPCADVSRQMASLMQDIKMSWTDNSSEEMTEQLSTRLQSTFFPKHYVVLSLLELGYTVHAADADIAFAPYRNVWKLYEEYSSTSVDNMNADVILSRNFRRRELDFDRFLVAPSNRTICLWREWLAEWLDVSSSAVEDGESDFSDAKRPASLIPRSLFQTCKTEKECNSLPQRITTKLDQADLRQIDDAQKDGLANVALFRVHRTPWYPKGHRDDSIGLMDNAAECSVKEKGRVPKFDPCNPVLIHVKPVCSHKEGNNEAKKKQVLQQLGFWFLQEEPIGAEVLPGGDSKAPDAAREKAPFAVSMSVQRYRPIIASSASEDHNQKAIEMIEKFQSCSSRSIKEAEDYFEEVVDKINEEWPWHTGRGAAEGDEELKRIDARDVVEPLRPGSNATYIDILKTCKSLECLRHAHSRQSVNEKKAFNFPHMLLIGYQKSATTSIFAQLRKHKKVRETPTKEPEFFTLKCHADPVNGCSRGQQAHYVRNSLRLNDYVNADGDVMVFEASTHYAMNGDVLAHGVHKVMPWVKIVASLREPISRAASMLVHNMARNRRGCLMKPEASLYQCLVSSSQLVGHPGPWNYLDSPHGNYSLAIQSWLSEFPSDQVHIVQYEKITKGDHQSETELKRLMDFLDLKQDSSRRNEESLEKQNVRKDRYQSDGWFMQKSEYMDLIDRVKPDVKNLGRLLEEHGQAKTSEWIRLWEDVWEENLASCDANDNCLIQLS